MPSSQDHPIPDFDDLHFGASPPALQFAPSIGGKKAKKKARKLAKQRVEDEEDTPYAKSITPSPPAAAADGGFGPVDTPPVRPEAEFEDVPEWTVDRPDAERAVVHDLSPRIEPEVVSEAEPPDDALIGDFGDDAAAAWDEPEPAAKPLGKQAPATYSPTASPRPQRARPVSASPASPIPGNAVPIGNRDGFGTHRRPSDTRDSGSRRESLFKPTSPRPRPSFVEAPPPHLAQAHFFGAPDLGFNLTVDKADNGKLPGSAGYCCSFDSFADAGDLASAKKAKDALLVGWEGGLDAYRVLADKMEVVGRLEGLRGGVFGAKILPITAVLDDLHYARPLIAVVIHGPMHDHHRGATSHPDNLMDELAAHYQTTVEVYSLLTQKHVATLYRSLPVVTPQPVLGQLASAPEPIGDLRLDAAGRFITVASGKSGEVFVFTNTASRDEDEPLFRCIGKHWTALQSRFDMNPRPTSAEGGQAGNAADEPRTAPLLSLSQRWLTIVCPSSSSKISIQGTPSLSSRRPHPIGLNSHVSPAQPPVTCEVVGLNAEGAISRLTRQAAQELLKASRRGIELGWAGWREFTNPSPPTARTANHARTDSSDSPFPPTHAPPDDPRRLAREPAVVSIVDLERYLDAEQHQAKAPPPPLSTFALEDGCNFLSLSSDGLKLLTTSRRGEISTMWDLKQAAHGPLRRGTEDDSEEPHGPLVERVQRVVRNTQSVVLGAAWSRDDDLVALLTANGTIHLHEVARRAALRRRRRRRSTATAPIQDNKADATVGVSQGMSPPSSNGLLGSIKSSWQSVSTQVSAMRTGAPSAQAFGIPTSFAGFKDTANAARAAGGRVVVRGLTQGYSAAKTGVGDMWHADDNKIRHSELRETTSTSLRWIRRKAGPSIAVACGGKVFLHPIQRVTRERGDLTVTGLKAERGGRREFGLPPISTGTAANACVGQGPHGFWSLRMPPSVETRHAADGAPFGQQTNEVETNPPYCPFHVDARVSMLMFNDAGLDAGVDTWEHGSDAAATFDALRRNGFGSSADAAPWCFGDALPPSVKINDRTGGSDVDEDDGVEDEGEAVGEDAEGDALGGIMESRLKVHPAGQEIRINTRRRRGRRRAGGGADYRQTTADGEFELLEDDEDDSLM